MKAKTRTPVLLCVAAVLGLFVPKVRGDLFYLDQPTPVSLKHGEFMVSTRLQSGGGIMARAGIGLFDRLTLGLSYSVDSLFGAATPVLAPVSAIGVQARLLGLDEGQYNPSILVGFESQGYDGYESDSNRFVTLPLGPYLLLGKTFWAPRLDVSIGANYWPGASSGFDGHLALREFYLPDWDFILEYDLGLDDHPGQVFPGLLNLAISRTINGNLYLKLGLRDILGCHKDNLLNRVFDISFQQHF